MQCVWIRRCVVVALMAFAPIFAHALIPTVAGWTWGGPDPVTYYPDALSACQARPSLGPFVTSTVGPPSTVTGSASQADCVDGRDGVKRFVVDRRGTTCPANSVPSGSSCACASTHIENPTHTSCIPKPSECEAIAGQSAGNSKWEAGTGVSPFGDVHYYCDGWNPAAGGKCVAKADREVCAKDGATWYCSGSSKYTGATASTCTGLGGSGDDPQGSAPKPADGTAPDKPPPGTTAPDPCPLGQAPGDVNGRRVCAPTGSDQPTSARDTSEVKNPDGSTTRTNSDTNCEKGGAKCVTDTTKCTKAAGSSLETCETTSTTQSRDAKCAQDPGSNACKDGDEEGSKYGGNCASGFVCKGDAIQCAIAQEQSKARCEYENFNLPWKQTSAVDVTDGSVASGFKSNGDAATAGAWTSWVNASNVTAACPAGYPMTLLGQQYVLSLKPLCDIGEGSRPIVIAVALLVALRTFLMVVTRD